MLFALAAHEEITQLLARADSIQPGLYRRRFEAGRENPSSGQAQHIKMSETLNGLESSGRAPKYPSVWG